MARYEVPGLLRIVGRRVSPRLHLFVCDVDQQRNEGVG